MCICICKISMGSGNRKIWWGCLELALRWHIHWMPPVPNSNLNTERQIHKYKPQKHSNTNTKTKTNTITNIYKQIQTQRRIQIQIQISIRNTQIKTIRPQNQKYTNTNTNKNTNTNTNTHIVPIKRNQHSGLQWNIHRMPPNTNTRIKIKISRISKLLCSWLKLQLISQFKAKKRKVISIQSLHYQSVFCVHFITLA